MPAKQSLSAAQVLTVVFTSLVAPVIVNFTAQTLNDHRPTRDRAEARLATDAILPTVAAASAATSDPLVRLLAEGVGSTPEQAIQNALRNGLARALAAQVDRATWRQYGPVLLEQTWGQTNRVVRGWREISMVKQGRAAQQATIAIDLDRQALLDCSRVAAREYAAGTPYR